LLHLATAFPLSCPTAPTAGCRQTKLVVKPDCLFGKRGKHDLVGLKLDYSQAEEFIKARMNKV
jgi:succinyl-CoA synthetase beta subunit